MFHAGTSVEIPADQYEIIQKANPRTHSRDTLIRNVLTYGKAMPSEEEFAEHRELLNFRERISRGPTGFESLPAERIFGELVKGAPEGTRERLLLVELAQRFSRVGDFRAMVADHAKMEAQYEEWLSRASDLESRIYRLAVKEDAAVKQVEALERRIAFLKEELPEEVTASDRKLQL